MSDKSMRTIGYACIALIIFVCSLVIIRWVIDFVTWSAIDNGWAQVLGSFAGLIIAVGVMHWQHGKTVRRDADAERSQTLNMLKALRSEILLFRPLVRARITSEGAYWPSLEISFPIYHACAGQIGMLKNDRVRSVILQAYLKIQTFFVLANDYSVAARELAAQRRRLRKEQLHVAALWGMVAEDGGELIPIINEMEKILSHAISEVEAVSDHAAAPKSWE